MNNTLDEIISIVCCEDWPALEVMGKETTSVPTKLLLDLSDAIEKLIESRENTTGGD